MPTIERVILSAKELQSRLTVFNELGVSAAADPSMHGAFASAYTTAKNLVAEFTDSRRAVLLDESNDESLSSLWANIGKIDLIMAKIEGQYNSIVTNNRLLSRPASVASIHSVASQAASLPEDPCSRVSSPGSAALGPQSSANEVRRCNVKLPKITLPVFSGELGAWSSWFDLFSTLIHNNDALMEIEKFQYLLSSVCREPLNLIKQLPLSARNYHIAFDMMKKRYQNDRILVTYYWKNLFNAPKVASDSPQAVRALLNCFEENVSALQQYPDVNLWDFTLLNTMLGKLDSATRKRFELQYATTSVPSYDELREFVSAQCHALEADILAQEYSSTSRTKTGALSRPKSMVAKLPTSPKVPSSAEYCVLCRGQHHISRCNSFRSLSVPHRRDSVAKAQLCFNCLRPSHTVAQCQSRSRCRQCNGTHHTLLHPNATSSAVRRQPRESHPPIATTFPGPAPGGDSTTALFTNRNVSQTVLLATALIEIQDSCGNYSPCRALLDSGSQASFIVDSVARRLNLTRNHTRVAVLGIDNSRSGASCGVSRVLLRSRQNSNKIVPVDAIRLPNICGDLPGFPLHANGWPHLAGITLADPLRHKPGQIDILLGADVYPLLVTGGHIPPPVNVAAPSAVNTHFGWVLLGPTRASPPEAVRSFLAATEFPVEAILRRFWEIEEVPSTSPLSQDELKSERIFSDTHSRDVNGCFEVALSFKAGHPPVFSDTLTQADRRLACLERRLTKQPELGALYSDFMQDYLDRGHMSLLEHPPAEAYYIPHHAVLKPNGRSIRVVFDASANDSSGTGQSLNASQLIGPRLQADIGAVLLNFRAHRYVFTCDVQQMYRQIQVREDHRRFQLIRWRFSSDQPIQTYRLNTVTYGVSSSPFLAIRALHQLALEGAVSHPLAANAILSSLYVDDFACGADSLTTAKQVQAQLIALLKTGCFQLRKWASSHPRLLDGIPVEHCQPQPLTFEGDSPPIMKVLGLQWHSSEDVFTFELQAVSSVCSKRSILSEIARIFDPLGFLSPLSLLAKHLIQHLWLLGLDWDERPPNDVCERWQSYQAELKGLSALRIPRFSFGSHMPSCELHAFCDASERGYAAAVYTRVTNMSGEVGIHLLIAKSKVAPVKRLTVPRLELCAAVLLAKLVTFVANTYQGRQFIRVVGWSDSTIVLSWIRSSPHRFKVFVANRISQIHDRLPPECWRHVPSPDNPADPASRGLLPTELLACPLWWEGPRWLSFPPSSWPSDTSRDTQISPTESEEKRVSLPVVSQTSFISTLLDKYSSFKLIQGIVAWCLRFAHNLKNPTKLKGPLTAWERHSALKVIVRLTQRDIFPAEIESVRHPTCR